MVVVTNKIYLNSSALQNLATRNIQHVNLNYCDICDDIMEGCFQNNPNIVSVSNISPNVQSIRGIYGGDNDEGCFYNCQNLTDAPDLSYLSGTTYFQGCFKNCQNLVNVPSAPVHGSARMMFAACKSLVNAPDMSNSYYVGPDGCSYMFDGCSSLTDALNLPVSIDYTGMFRGCENLINVGNLPSYDGLGRADEMFAWCTNLVNAPSLSSISSMISIFHGCTNLVNAPEIPDAVAQLSQAFAECSSLTDAPDMTNLFAPVINLYATFIGCTNLVNVPGLPNFSNEYVSSGIENIAQTFQGCSSLVSVLDFVNVTGTSMLQTFMDCTNLAAAPNIPNSIANMFGTFSGCENITSAPEIPNAVSDMYATFRNCYNLTGDVIIHSEIVQSANECFNNTSLTKNVYIPFNVSNNIDIIKWTSFVGENSSMQVFVKGDIYNITNGMENWYDCGYLYNNISNAEMPGSRCSYDYIDGQGHYYLEYWDNDVWMHENAILDTVNNVGVHKSAGDSSFTYDSFTNAGYGTDPSNRVDGVCLFDINV